MVRTMRRIEISGRNESEISESSLSTFLKEGILIVK